MHNTTHTIVNNLYCKQVVLSVGLEPTASLVEKGRSNQIELRENDISNWQFEDVLPTFENYGKIRRLSQNCQTLPNVSLVGIDGVEPPTSV